MSCRSSRASTKSNYSFLLTSSSTHVQSILGCKSGCASTKSNCMFDYLITRISLVIDTTVSLDPFNFLFLVCTSVKGDQTTFLFLFWCALIAWAMLHGLQYLMKWESTITSSSEALFSLSASSIMISIATLFYLIR